MHVPWRLSAAVARVSSANFVFKGSQGGDTCTWSSRQYVRIDIGSLRKHPVRGGASRRAPGSQTGGRILPGLRMPRGSIRCFRPRIKSIAAGGCEKWRACVLSEPMPCSALTLPPLLCVHSYTKGSRMAVTSCTSLLHLLIGIDAILHRPMAYTGAACAVVSRPVRSSLADEVHDHLLGCCCF